MKRKYENNFIYDTPPHPISPEMRKINNNIGIINTLYINNELQGKIKGAFFLDTTLVVRPTGAEKPRIKPHYHDSNEYLIFHGTDPEDPFNLGGEVEFWVDGEKYIVNKSCAVFIPKGLLHGPLTTLKVERPFLSISVSNTLNYKILKLDDNPVSH
jgi:hypothetical protein